MFNVLIVDDNKVARVLLAQMLKKIESIKIAGEYEDAPSVISALEKEEIDILFLDVEMPGMTGIELLRVIPQRPLTILVTAKPGYAAEAFELNVVDYLVKPFSVSRVIMAVEKAMELLRVKNIRLNVIKDDHLFLREGKTIRKILLQTVLWMEAKGDYVKIVTLEENYVIHTTLRSVEEKLLGREFVRIHRGYVVPISKIDYVEDNVAFIQGLPLPVSDTYKNNFLKQLRLL